MFALGALQSGFELKIKNILLNRCFKSGAMKERGRTRLVPQKQEETAARNSETGGSKEQGGLLDMQGAGSGKKKRGRMFSLSF